MLEHLSPREETKVHRLMQKRATERCDSFIRAFIACSHDRTLSLAWACKPQKAAMLDCMHLYTNANDLDQAKEIFLRERADKLRAWQAANPGANIDGASDAASSTAGTGTAESKATS